MKKFLGWLGGILATVIAGYALYLLTRPVTTTFEGMVINGPEVAPLANAIVSVEFAGRANGGPFHDSTDEHGAYRLDFTSLGDVSAVTIAVQAEGFQPTPPVTLRKIVSDTHQDFVLTAEGSPSPPPPLPGGAAAGEAHPPLATRMPVYVQKPAAKAFKFTFQTKP